MRSPVGLGAFGLRCRLQNWFRSGAFRRNRRHVGLIGRDLEVLISGSQPGRCELMPERLGLDPAFVKLFHTSTYQDLQRVCASCKAWRRCARDLARGAVQSGMESYCLNAPGIDALLVGRPPWEESP